ncbi:MAG TPA: hypothetical protein VGG63_16385 [Steroidobacteraceae bacterium]|jgi:hypothetical protein
MPDVALTIDGLAGQIILEHRAALEHAETAVGHARRAGSLLLEARQQFDRGDWLPWLTAHCPEISERMAQRYIQVARHPELEAGSLREALFKLAGPAKPNNPTRVSASPSPALSPPVDDGPADPELLSDSEMLEEMEREERQYQESISKVMEADDTLSAANAEIKRQAAEIAVLKTSRDGFMNGKAAITELLQAEQRKAERQSKLIDHLRKEIETLKAGRPADTEALQQQVEKLEGENERLRERIAIMEESA